MVWIEKTRPPFTLNESFILVIPFFCRFCDVNNSSASFGTSFSSNNLSRFCRSLGSQSPSVFTISGSSISVSILSSFARYVQYREERFERRLERFLPDRKDRTRLFARLLFARRDRRGMCEAQKKFRLLNKNSWEECPVARTAPKEHGPLVRRDTPRPLQNARREGCRRWCRRSTRSRLPFPPTCRLH